MAVRQEQLIPNPFGGPTPIWDALKRAYKGYKESSAQEDLDAHMGLTPEQRQEIVMGPVQGRNEPWSPEAKEMSKEGYQQDLANSLMDSVGPTMGSTRAVRELGPEAARVLKQTMQDTQMGRNLLPEGQLQHDAASIIDRLKNSEASKKIRNWIQQGRGNYIHKGVDIKTSRATPVDEEVIKQWRHPGRGAGGDHPADRVAREVLFHDLGLTPETRAVMTPRFTYMVQEFMDVKQAMNDKLKKGLISQGDMDDWITKANAYIRQAKDQPLPEGMVHNDYHLGNVGVSPKTGEFRIVDPGFGPVRNATPTQVAGIQSKVMVTPSRKPTWDVVMQEAQKDNLPEFVNAPMARELPDLPGIPKPGGNTHKLLEEAGRKRAELVAAGVPFKNTLAGIRAAHQEEFGELSLPGEETMARAFKNLNAWRANLSAEQAKKLLADKASPPKKTIVEMIAELKAENAKLAAKQVPPKLPLAEKFKKLNTLYGPKPPAPPAMTLQAAEKEKNRLLNVLYHPTNVVPKADRPGLMRELDIAMRRVKELQEGK